MRKLNNQLIFSPSDLITFSDSKFDSWMERRFLEYPDEVQPDERDESLEIVARHGNTHELAFLALLKSEGYDIAEIDPKSEHAERDTIAAMRNGREIVYQGLLRAGEFAGLSDFLVKVPGCSDLGDFHYEVWDTKLSKKAKPYYLLQLCCYAEMLETIQGRLPGSVRVVLGDLSKKEFRTLEYLYRYRQLKAEFLEFQGRFSKDNPPEDWTAGAYSRWNSVSEKLLEDCDHLSRVANIRQSQIDRLRDADIQTMTSLSESSLTSIPKMTAATFSKLRQQAKLQIRSRRENTTVWELLPPAAGKGLALLPTPSRNDVYFDMEGYPLTEGGLEYLFGVVYEADEKLVFKDWWAHNREEEKVAFERFVDWIYARWIEDPGMHVYHYASYEVSAVKRLAGRHATRVEEIDNMLRGEVFVDLFQVVRQSLCVGEPSYSIKYIEHLYREKRSGTVSKATDSVVFYENWLEMPDGADWTVSRILKEIRDYNEEDCISTIQLAQWLRLRKEENGIVFSGKITEAPAVAREMTEAAVLARTLSDDADLIADPEVKRVQKLLAGLLEFHKREDKPMWQRMFERQKMSQEELCHDLDCLAGLKWTRRPAIPIKKSFGYQYSFDPNQDTKLEAGKSCRFVHDNSSTKIEELDRTNGFVTIVVGPSKPAPPEEIALMADEFVDATPISESIFRVCKNWHEKQEMPQALSDLLFRNEPQIKGRFAGSSIANGEDVRDVANAILRMQNTCLSIQGPPGTGKTYTASHSIVELLKQGKRVGITSNSHKAIDNLLGKVTELAESNGVVVHAAKVGPNDPTASSRRIPGVKQIRGSNSFFKSGTLDTFNVVAGTAWLFSNADAAGMLDYLFVDEAGQVSLANLTAVSPSTSNIVLLGDQMQLEQPIQGSHPGECGQSCLEYLLQERATIPDHLGIFLCTTRRMHADICDVISQAVYDSRLNSHPDNNKQMLIAPGQLSTNFSKRSGIVWIPVSHSGNTQASDEEVLAIENLVNLLLKCCVSDKHGDINVVTMRDILIVTPYNMQVRKIASRIPGACVASVDKFQGQEAPIVILSMCASEGSSSPRGLDFLFSRSRLNVAVSRAKTLAFVVGSPELVNTRTTSLKQMKLLSFFCQIVSAGRSAEAETIPDDAVWPRSA